MITCIKTDSDNEDFRRLVRELDADLQKRDGEEHTFYAQFNKIDRIKHVVVAYANNEVVGCGALQAYGVNRADRSFIPGGSVSGTGIIRPDFPELKEWPYFWQQTEYVLGGGTTDFLFMVLAAKEVLK